MPLPIGTPVMISKMFVSCTNEKIHAVHFYFIFSTHLAFYRALPNSHSNTRDNCIAAYPRPLHLHYLRQAQRDTTRPCQNPQRGGCDGTHAHCSYFPRWDCVHASECPSGNEVGRGGGTGVRDWGKFSGGVYDPQGDDEVGRVNFFPIPRMARKLRRGNTSSP